MEKLSKDLRASMLDKHLSGKGIPVYGRSTKIKNDMKATAATVAGWLSGSLPSDMMTALNFCNAYGLCPWQWVYGVRYTDVENSFDAKRIMKYMRSLENSHNLTETQFEEVFDVFRRDFDEGILFMNNLKSFLQK